MPPLTHRLDPAASDRDDPDPDQKREHRVEQTVDDLRRDLHLVERGGDADHPDRCGGNHRERAPVTGPPKTDSTSVFTAVATAAVMTTIMIATNTFEERDDPFEQIADRVRAEHAEGQLQDEQECDVEHDARKDRTRVEARPRKHGPESATLYESVEADTLQGSCPRVSPRPSPRSSRSQGSAGSREVWGERDDRVPGLLQATFEVDSSDQHGVLLSDA